MFSLVAATLSIADAVRTDTPLAGTNTHVPVNKAPLKPASFYKLPIGEVKPHGWVRKQLELEADGFTGHLTEISGFLDKQDNAWLSPTGAGKHGWEEVPYWLRGFGDLGWVLGDKRVQKETMVWIDGILGSQRQDGYFGPESNLTASDGKPDVWPNMLALNVLQSYAEATGDSRVVPFMTRYFQWQMTLPDDQFLTGYWENHRAADEMGSVLWLYNRTGNKALLELIDRLHRRSAPWAKGVANLHGVNFAQGFREPAEIGVARDDKELIEQADQNYNTMRAMYGQVPGGMYAADENARKGYTDPRQGTETCSFVEMMWSSEWLLGQTGDAVWGDRCEDVAFNSFPASMTPELKALRYLTCPNMVQSDSANKAPDIENRGKMLSYDPTDYRCCQHNAGFGWPYFAEHMWMASNENGLAALLYGPCEVRADVGNGATARITEDTKYPFEETVRFHFSLTKASKFPVTLRVPSWCKAPKIKVNGKRLSVSGNGAYLIVNRTWKTGDNLELSLPMELELRHWQAQKGAVSVDYGPLTFSLDIAQRKVMDGGAKNWPGEELFAASDWNYALIPDLRGWKVTKRPWPTNDQPFTEDGAPLELTARGRQLPDWSMDKLGMVGLLPQSPVSTSRPTAKLTLIPMGAARLRITVFPTVEG